MKRSLFGFLLLTMVIPSAFGQDASLAKTKERDFEKMTFEVELDKSSYFLFEPIFVTFKFSNKTEAKRNVYNPSFLSDSKVKVVLAGVSQTFDHLPRSSPPSVRFPASVPPKWNSSKQEMLDSPYVINFFPQVGEYRLQFILKDWESPKQLESNIVTVVISQPLGINRHAFNFLGKHYDFFGQTSWTLDGERGQTLLESFVKDYPDSVYTESVISSLGYVYLFKNEFEKAKIEFEKLRNSRHQVISSDAKRALAETERRIIASQKTKM